jgi:hypothetical protein
MLPLVDEEGLRHPVHQRLRRIVGDEALRQLLGNEVRRGRMPRQNIQHLLAVFDAAAGRDHVAQHDLLALVVQLVVVEEAAAFTRLLNAPAGEAARHFGDVFLRVAAVHAERVQLHQLAPVVLVQAALHFPLLVVGVQVRTHGLEIVQEEKHGRTLRGGFQQIAELAEHMRADGVAFVLRES